MNNKTNFKDWFIIACHSEDTATLNMETMTRPLYVAGKQTPESLNEITLGQMVELSQMKSGREMFYKVCWELLKIDTAQVDSARAVDVVRFVGWVLGRVKEINELFEKTKGNPSPEEVRAGINKLNFGVFGMIDWYAKRMGITDHEVVMSVPWIRLYKCLDMDSKTNEYQKRLAKIRNDEYRRTKNT